MRRRLASALIAITLAAAGAEPEASPPDREAHAPPTAFDPRAGIAAHGVIPRIARPPDLPNPERWRYVPAGRIKPGNFFQRFLVSSFAGPIAYYDREVGVGGGVSVTDIDFRERRRRENADITAARSSLGQERYTLDWQRYLAHRDLPDGGVFQEERSWERLNLGYDRVLTRRFYGFGPDTRRGDETSYTDEAGFARLLEQRSLPRAGDDTVMLLGARWEHHNLAAGHVAGRPSTDRVYPDLVAHADSTDLGWLTLGLGWDTRDSQRNPYRGWNAAATVDAAPLQSGERVGAIGGLRSSGILPVPGLFHGGGLPDEEDPPTDVLAGGSFVSWTMGDLPFNALPSLGGADTLRAYIADRFTGRAAWHASLEWRLWVVPRGFALTESIRVERLGLAPFADLGSVAPSLADLARARPRESIGLGLRAMVERAAIFRADVGWARDSASLTGRYGLSF